MTSTQIIVPWEQHRSFLTDEANREKLMEHVRKCGFDIDSPLENALHCVFENVGEAAFRYDRGVLRGRLEQLERVKERAKCQEDLMRPPSYTDREGFVHVPLDTALDLARKFCTVEPAAVLADVEATERKWSLKVTTSDGEYLVSLLNSYRAAWALIRQWCGMDAAIASREGRIAALEKLVWDAVYALQKAGLDNDADKLRRKLTS